MARNVSEAALNDAYFIRALYMNIENMIKQLQNHVYWHF